MTKVELDLNQNLTSKNVSGSRSCSRCRHKNQCSHTSWIRGTPSIFKSKQDSFYITQFLFSDVQSDVQCGICWERLQFCFPVPQREGWLTPLLKNWYDWEQFRMWIFLDGSRPWACVVYTVKTVENRRCNVALQLSVFPYEPCWHRLAHWDMTIGWFLFSNVWNFKFGMLPSWCIFAYTRLA